MALLSPEQWPLWGVIAAFVLGAAAIAALGSRLSRVSDRLADVTGMGEAIFGALLLGASTSIPEIVTSITTATAGYPQLAVSNAIGGISAQTAFLAIADITYRRANLEHAAASLENLMQGALLATLLSIPLIAMVSPEVTLLGVHPASIGLVIFHLFGMHLVAETRSAPLWTPRRTTETRTDVPQEARKKGGDTASLWLRFAGLAAGVGLAGYVVAAASMALVDRTFLSETIVGGLFTAVATSLPELVTALAAVRQGALTLAVGTIIGGNTFDVLFLAVTDVAYRDGSIYHAITGQQQFIIALAILLTGILVLGLLRRQKSGFGNIGFESVLILLLYTGGFALLAQGG